MYLKRKPVKVQESNVYIGNESRKEYLDRFIAGKSKFRNFLLSLNIDITFLSKENKSYEQGRKINKIIHIDN